MVTEERSQAQPVLRLSLLQIEPANRGIADSLAALDRAAAEAQSQQADILITPEMYLTGYNIGRKAVRAAAEPLTGPTLGAVARIAAERGLAIVVVFPELAGDEVFNTAAFITRDGDLLSSYRKTHLYGEVDEAQFSAGDALGEPFDYLGWRLAMAICFDIEFPEVARAHALAGVDAILTPTANMQPFTSVSTRLVPARAEENGVFVAYANFVGDESLFEYCGSSCVVGPDGEDIARAGTDAEVLAADLQHAELARVRGLSPYLSSLRTDLYPLPTRN